MAEIVQGVLERELGVVTLHGELEPKCKTRLAETLTSRVNGVVDTQIHLTDPMLVTITREPRPGNRSRAIAEATGFGKHLQHRAQGVLGRSPDDRDRFRSALARTGRRHLCGRAGPRHTEFRCRRYGDQDTGGDLRHEQSQHRPR
ncbi:hypothetical protein GCM10010174_07550 [Kutzneria viridogrisea]